MEELPPIEEPIKQYLKVKWYRDKFGKREVHRYLESLGYRHDENLTNSVMMGLCFKGHLIFLGWHQGDAVYQRMD